MTNDSCSPTRKANEPWKINNFKRMKAQRTNDEEPRHFQKWMEKVEWLTMGELDDGDCGVEEVCRMAFLF